MALMPGLKPGLWDSSARFKAWAFRTMPGLKPELLKQC